jgi:hypothetical protein
VKAGANVNAVDAQKVPLLEKAKKISSENVVKMLELAGAKGAEPPPPPEPTPEELAKKAEAEKAEAEKAEKPKKKH